MKNVILNKIADKGFQKLRYEKVEDNENLVSYEIYDIKYHFTKCIDVCYKSSGRHLVQSYQKRMYPDGYNRVVGMTGIETLLIFLKMLGKGWYSNQSSTGNRLRRKKKCTYSITVTMTGDQQPPSSNQN